MKRRVVALRVLPAFSLCFLAVGCSDVMCPEGRTEIQGRCLTPEEAGSTGEATQGQTGTAGVGIEVGSAGSAAAPSMTASDQGVGGMSMVTTAGAGAGMPPTSGEAAGSAGNASAAGAPASAGAGAAGQGSNCVPSNELCDNLDNDCDSRIDEGVTPRPCGNATPPCRQGTQSCSAGVWSTECVGDVKPTDEVCDGVDNDCTGVPDEGCACTDGERKACGNARPPCRTGMLTCTNGAWPSVCEGEVKGSSEICDGVDNDCDGVVDQGGDSLCSGSQRCWGVDECGECAQDADCSRAAAGTCQVSYCDLTRHTCEQKDASDGTTCNGTDKCKTGRCVDCLTNADCGSDNMCGSNNTCMKTPTCGDGVRDTGEECDDGNLSDQDDCVGRCKNARCGDGFWNEQDEECDASRTQMFSEFSCDSSCKKRSFYTPCSTNSDCLSGWACNQGTVCMHPVAQASTLAECDSLCPRIDSSNHVFCYQVLCMLACDTNDDCDRNSRCVTDGWSGTTDGSGRAVNGICAR